MLRELKFKIVERMKIAEDTYEIRLTSKEPFEYKAGQYVTIKVGEKLKDGRGSLRAFSLSSSPNNEKYISTCFRLPEKHSDFKKYLMECPLGTKVIVDGPKGDFVLPKREDKGIVLIAGGIGITPFMSMIRWSSEVGSNHKIKLIYTDKSKEEMAYYDELKKLDGRNFSFVSRFERVDENFFKENCDLGRSLFYICGKAEMVRDVRDMLLRLGVREEDILPEEFSGY